MPYLPPLTAAELTSLEAWWRDAGGDLEPDPCGDDPAPVDERGRAQQLLTHVVTSQRRVARAEAEIAQALSALVALYRGPGTGDEVADSEALLEAVEEVAEEVAPALRWTPVTAAGRVSQAVRLVEDLPATLAALACGDLDAARVRVVVDGTVTLSAEDARTVDAELCGPQGRASALTTGRLRAEVGRRVHAVDAAALARRARRATADRRVTFMPLLDGMAQVCAVGPAPALRDLYDRLTVEALAVKRDPGSIDPCADATVDGESDRRGLDAIRFDLLTSSPTGTGTSTNAGTTVLVALPTLLGADDAPAELSGYGPVPAWLARRAAADARLRRVLVDPFTGQLTAIDGHTYPAGWLTPGSRGPAPGGVRDGTDGVLARTTNGPPADHAPPPDSAEPPSCDPVRLENCPVHLSGGGPYEIPTHTARLVRARTPRCTGAGCRVPAARCDLDHVVRHPDGPTCPCNLTPLCRRHHRMKHRSASWRRWRVHRCEDGHLHWTSPLGHHHVVIPEPLLPQPIDRDADQGDLESLRYPPDATARRSPARSPRGPAAEAPGPATRGWAGTDPDAPPF